MADITFLSAKNVIFKLRESQKPEYMFLIGAGASLSSGAPLASEMIDHFRRRAFDSSDTGDTPFEDWCRQQAWYQSDTEYGELFEKAYDSEAHRQAYVEHRLNDVKPGWGYLYLANLIATQHINLVLTTNFDDLLNDALKLYLGYNAVVCSADSQVATIRFVSDRARIIKLHGDYLFQKLKNTPEETKRLDPNMRDKFEAFAQEYGLIVIGYSGQDRSIMDILRDLLSDGSSFPYNVYWGVRQNRCTRLVKELATDYPKKFRVFHCEEFDGFFAQLHDALNLALPTAIVQPFTALRERFGHLLKQPATNSVIVTHRKQLAEQLDSALAKLTDEGDTALLNAQINLYGRRYPQALAELEKYAAGREPNPLALIMWGHALEIKAQEEGLEPARDAAAEKWKQAAALDERSLQARYNLLGYYHQRQAFSDAIQTAEWLKERVKNDASLRSWLVNFYGFAGRHRDALREVDDLLEKNSEDARLHFLRANVLDSLGMPSEALSAMKRAVKLSPKDPQMWVWLGFRAQAVGRFDEALAAFQNAVQFGPNDIPSRIQISRLMLFTVGNVLGAISHLEGACSIDPALPEVLYLLSIAYARVERRMDARKRLEEAVVLSPDHPGYCSTLGVLCAGMNDIEPAIRAFKTTLTLQESAHRAMYWLALCYRMANRQQELLGAFNRLQSLNAQLIEPLKNRLGNWEQTLAAIQGLSELKGVPL